MKLKPPPKFSPGQTQADREKDSTNTERPTDSVEATEARMAQQKAEEDSPAIGVEGKSNAQLMKELSQQIEEDGKESAPPKFEYHITYEVQAVGVPITRDIIVTLNEPITGKNYMSLKNQLAQQAGFADGNLIVILSVTLL